MTDLPEITDGFMGEMLAKTKMYTVVLLKKATPERDFSLVVEHGRRNFALRAIGKLAIVCPVMDDSDLAGVGIFDADLEEVKRLYDEDPGVKAGIFTYEMHEVRSFPGDALP